MLINETYDISIEGKVTNLKTGRVLKTFLAGKGYECLRLGVGKKYYIHSLVAKAFLPQPTSENCVIDHIDRNKLNNHASNLRWVSYSENSTNRTIEIKPRKNNKSEHHHIKKVISKRQKNPSYIVVFSGKRLKHYSCHSTIEEAIKKRDTIIETHGL